MTLRANHLTLMRIVLLPLPYFLVYMGTWARMVALLIFFLLGLTDYLDGLLARRQGCTPLGKLLDPIADKIFIVVIMIPLVDLDMLPLWLIWPIFLREFLVTELRRFLSGGNEQLPVTELAKIKTTLQMIGAGLILLTDTFPDKTVTIAFLSGALLSTAFLATGIYWRFGEFSFRMKAALVLLLAGLMVALIFNAQNAILIYGLAMLFITLFTGFQYASKGLPACFKQGPMAVARLVSSLSLPLITLALMPFVSKGANPIITWILSMEFATQGLDMWSATSQKKDISWIKTRIITPSLITALLVLYLTNWNETSVTLYITAVAAASSIYGIVDFWIHRDLFSSSNNPA